MTASATAQRDQMLAEATSQRDKIISEATAKRDEMLTEARERSTGMVAEAQQKKAALLEDLERQKTALDRKIEDCAVSSATTAPTSSPTSRASCTTWRAASRTPPRQAALRAERGHHLSNGTAARWTRAVVRCLWIEPQRRVAFHVCLWAR